MPEGRYRLYYAGLDDAQIEQIGVAVSNDLHSWSRPFTSPIIPIGSSGEADAVQTSNPYVLREGETYRMWYQGKATSGRNSICYAESTDGLSWNAKPECVFAPPGAPTGEYREGYQHPHVLYDGLYRMWFSSQKDGKTSIALAESTDGRSWTLVSEEVLVPREEWEGNHLYYPFVTKTASGYDLFYTGRGKGHLWRIGRATSTDGNTFERVSDNPVVPRALAPGMFRTLARFGIGLPGSTAVLGSGSPCIFTGPTGETLMLTHDVGLKGRLSISIYEKKGEEWIQRATNVLRDGRSSWDAYFQADPFIV